MQQQNRKPLKLLYARVKEVEKKRTARHKNNNKIKTALTHKTRTKIIFHIDFPLSFFRGKMFGVVMFFFFFIRER